MMNGAAGAYRRTRLTRQRLVRTAAAALLATTLGACADGHSGEPLGTLIGAGLGAWIGSEIGGSGDSRVVGAAIGTLAGAAIGNSIGRSLDRADRLAMAQARYQALEATPSGETTEWINPDSGNSGTFVPEAAYEDDAGQYCREYQQTITVGGQTEQGYGTACRQPDGAWKIVSG